MRDGPIDGSDSHTNYEEIHGVIEWVKLLSKIDDKKVSEICGTDVALYLVFLRYSSNLFGAIALFNVIMVILYLTGSPLDDDDFRQAHLKVQHALQALTILNITANSPKIVTCFIYSMAVIPFMFFTLLLLYLQKFHDLNHKRRENRSSSMQQMSGEGSELADVSVNASEEEDRGCDAEGDVDVE